MLFVFLFNSCKVTVIMVFFSKGNNVRFLGINLLQGFLILLLVLINMVLHYFIELSELYIVFQKKEKITEKNRELNYIIWSLLPLKFL